MKLWNGHKLNKLVEDFTVGNDYIFDQKLLKFDCLASVAHVRMLGKIGILKTVEVGKIVKELGNIIELDRAGKFKIKKEEEDCHTAIENYLTKKLGDLGKKIHTGRSRNDQSLTALRLYFKVQLREVGEIAGELLGEIKKFIVKYGKTEMPGYTHYRKAMPSTIENWAGSFVESMEDNLKLVRFTAELIDQSPLGTGAGYGVPLKIDREYTARILGFKRVQENSLYAQNSRGKFESIIIQALTQLNFDLNKIASDLIIFTMPEFGYFELPAELCTGSSIMPQKKNPDVLELLRGNYQVICSFEFCVKGLIGNLISGYSRDFQLTKEAVIKAFETTKDGLLIMKLVFEKLKVNGKMCKKGMSEEVYATREVYKLVEEGIPFREAYKTIAKKYAQ